KKEKLKITCQNKIDLRNKNASSTMQQSEQSNDDSVPVLISHLYSPICKIPSLEDCVRFQKLCRLSEGWDLETENSKFKLFSSRIKVSLDNEKNKTDSQNLFKVIVNNY
ncbi:MAG: hypothetical protein MHPSP_001162, partial [Paramarteilia canceri]